MEAHLRRRADSGGEGSVIDRIKAMIANAPLDGPPHIAAVAARLGLSLPTLHRRLRAAGTSWRGLLDDHRMAAAARMLRETSRSVADVALAVGYAESASFSRAFTRHFGKSPRERRR
jgi:AraC-like DNA-binding protein